MNYTRLISEPVHCLLAVACFAVFGAGAASAQQGAEGPELRLFSSTIVEDIRRTGEAAATMELDVIGSVEAMDRQLELYQASACDGAGQDQGCGEMRRQLTESYGAMLDAMGEALPQMEDAIARSRDGLQQSLVSQLGRGASSTELMTLLLDDGGGTASSRPTRSDGSTRLSERFRQYHSLVAGSSNGTRGGRGALAVTAADIYLEMQEASELIAITRDEIARAQIANDIELALPRLTDEMEATVEGVKRVLFGEGDAAAATVATPPPRTGDTVGPGDFESELEF